jgi:hypothetical protein
MPSSALASSIQPRSRPVLGANASGPTTDKERMNRRLSLVTMALGLVIATSPTPADAARPPAHTKKQAEVNVLRATARRWKARRLPGLVDPRTHLLVDNTEAVCHGQGKRRPGNRYVRFLCVVRPHIHTRRQGLYVTYRALQRRRFTIRWLDYRRH